MIKKLEDDNDRPDITVAQKEVNEWRIKYIKLMNRPKAVDEPYTYKNPVVEALKDPKFTCAPNLILGKQ
ncbi:hypothetical protein [Priestia megaterium]|uniref:hypothetical protein n=1 Tax=Priestia megaterium TaxID=1404 RepID=UPI00115A8C5A|nr:hypothetical protein [Priestia megaterium]